MCCVHGTAWAGYPVGDRFLFLIFQMSCMIGTETLSQILTELKRVGENDRDYKTNVSD